MADQLPEQIRKHQHGSDIDEPIQKHQETDGEDAAANAVEAKTLTNIYYDCLERIFDFLDLQSLLNVAGTCKRLQTAAAAKFGDDYGKKPFVIACSDGNREPIFRVDKYSIYVQSLKSCFPFLRCFGAKISNLRLIGHNEHVDAYVNQYCANTLTGISYTNKSQFPAQAFQKPFKHVKSVQLNQCDLKDQLPNFVNWFPNIQVSTVDSCSVDTTTANFPNLKELMVSFYSPPSRNLAIENFKNLFQSNQQVQNIFFASFSELKFSTLLDMINGNMSIVNLWILAQSEDVTMVDLDRLAAEHPSVKVLCFYNCRFAADDVIQFIQKLNKLKKFQFSVNDRSECDRLASQLGEEWHHEIKATDDSDFKITLKRKHNKSNLNGSHE